MALITNDSFFQDFLSEVKPRLPWAQILNPPGGLTINQLEAFGPKINHGFFVNKNNVELANIDISSAEWRTATQEFQGGKEIVEGYITNQLRFCLLGRTETIVESDGVYIGPLFVKNSNNLSEAGIASRDNSKEYQRRSWWLIMLLAPNNEFIHTTPIKLALSGATGAALTQELTENIKETESGFFHALGQPVQQLSETAKKMFIYDWTLNFCKPNNLAPYEYVGQRKGTVPSKSTVVRYSSGIINRSVVIEPVDSIQNAIFSLKSPQGQKLIELSQTFCPLFFESFHKRTGEITGEVTDFEHQEVISENPVNPVNPSVLSEGFKNLPEEDLVF